MECRTPFSGVVMKNSSGLDGFCTIFLRLKTLPLGPVGKKAVESDQLTPPSFDRKSPRDEDAAKSFWVLRLSKARPRTVTFRPEGYPAAGPKTIPPSRRSQLVPPSVVAYTPQFLRPT